MMRSMYSGVAGLKTHQTRMDVIGNNIANVNTVGYKAQAALFAELLYQNSASASGPNPTMNKGGINPKQVGLGVKMASISTNITLPGSAETTNNPFDLRITGSSFFVVNNGKDTLFTRDGSFKVDAAGNLVMSSTGYKVMGWQVDPDNEGVIKPDTVSALQIMGEANMTYPPEATKQATVAGIIDADSPEVNTTAGKVMNLNFYDSRGYSYTAKMTIRRVSGNNDNVNSYSCELMKLLDAAGNDVTATIGPSMGSVNVKIPQEEKTLANGYTLTGTGTTYTLAGPAENTNGDHIVYTITDGTVTAQAYKGTGSTDADKDASRTISEDDAWKGVAKAFGYDDVAEFKKMRATATGAPTDGYLVGSQLGTIIANSGTTTDGTWSWGATNKLTMTGRSVAGCSIDFSKVDGSFWGLNGTKDTKTTELSFGVGAGATADAASFETITIDFSSLKNVGNQKVSTAAIDRGSLKNEGTGRKIGKMSGISIQQDGKIYANYDNGMSKLLGQLAFASFANASGLQKEGDNLYASTQNSGDFDGIGIDISSDGGYVTTGELEMSNVDLSGELTGMIVTQRGFQANSRIITVSDTMLEELINLKR